MENLFVVAKVNLSLDEGIRGSILFELTSINILNTLLHSKVLL